MSGPTPNGRDRLDSWKAVAEYLNRDVATVRRWEKTLGLPVRRVSGRGRSVFAYREEIEAWLGATPSTARAVDLPARHGRRRLWLAMAMSVAAATVAMLAWRGGLSGPVGPLSIETSRAGVVARDAQGRERWRHLFPTEYDAALSEVAPASRLVLGEDPAVYVATSHRVRRADDVVEGGSVMELDLEGRVRRSFAFDDEVVFYGTRYGAPWAVTTFAVEGAGAARQLAVASHHWLWDPSLITVLDHKWRRRATFVHAGWIEQLQWLAPDRLLVGGFSHPQDGGMVALLDTTAMNGQGPEPAGTRYHCDTCGSDRPLRMVVMPRSELNLVTASRFNRAVVEVLPDRIIVRTIEIPAPGEPEAADALYEFTRELDLTTASFGERYWNLHRALEAERKLTHSREECPDRDGPRAVLLWEPHAGWRTVHTRAAAIR
ncbi:MAG: hypothetical protein HY657_15280 [Acidobacteria bacterium]|nr:hypothetical protein [Acidobacteriota bacterium]